MRDENSRPLEHELFRLWADQKPEYDHDLIKELAALVAGALNDGAAPVLGPSLRNYLKRQALAAGSPQPAWSFLWVLEKSGRSRWPGNIDQWLAVWPPIIDQAAEEQLKAAAALGRLRLQEEIRGLHLFLKRAGFNLEELAVLNQQAPFCQPPETKVDSE